MELIRQFVTTVLTHPSVIHGAKVFGFILASTALAALADATRGLPLDPTTAAIVNIVIAGWLKALQLKREELATSS